MLSDEGLRGVVKMNENTKARFGGIAQLIDFFKEYEKQTVAVVSALLIAIGWLAYLLNWGEAPFKWLMLTAAVIAGYKIALNAYHALRFRVLGIPALVTMASVGAIVIGEYWEAAAVTFLFSFGSYLEAKTMDKTRNALRELMELAPQTARVTRNNKEIEVPAEEVVVGEIVLVRPGEKISVDGSVSTGHGAVNEAAITGESMPVDKQIGASVFGGSINETGYLEIVAEKTGDDTTFAKIIELVEEAQEDKAPTQEFLERFARYYTPGIMLLALGIFLWTKDTPLALTFLVIACPGALVIATPVSIVAGTGNAAKNAVLIKGGEHLERAGKITAIAFDKTGTLTYGKPRVIKVHALVGTEEELLNLAGAAEKMSEHPLAQAIANAASDNLPKAENFQAIPGRGVKANVNGQQLIIGNRELLQENNYQIDDRLEQLLQHEENSGRTAMIVGEAGTIRGYISVADVLRDDARQIVNRLKQLGIKKTLMLTGDNMRTARAIAEQVGIDEFRAQCLPEDKVKVIHEQQQLGEIVAMVGDGINDAPALAAADVGVAMGVAGSDVAIETADIALMADNLSKLPYAIGISRSTLRNIKQNVVFAVLVVLILLGGVLGRVVFLASGMLVHEVSVLLVILNAMRLLNYRDKVFSSQRQT